MRVAFLLAVAMIANAQVEYTIRNSQPGTMSPAIFPKIGPNGFVATSITVPTKSIFGAKFDPATKQSFTAQDTTAGSSTYGQNRTVLVSIPAVVSTETSCSQTDPKPVDVWTVAKLLSGYNCAIQLAVSGLSAGAAAPQFVYDPHAELFGLNFTSSGIRLFTTYEVARVFGNLAGPTSVSYPPPYVGFPKQFEYQWIGEMQWQEFSTTHGMFDGIVLAVISSCQGKQTVHTAELPSESLYQRAPTMVDVSINIPKCEPVGATIELNWIDSDGDRHPVFLHHSDRVTIRGV